MPPEQASCVLHRTFNLARIAALFYQFMWLQQVIFFDSSWHGAFFGVIGFWRSLSFCGSVNYAFTTYDFPMAGRPSKPALERRNYPLRIRLNDAERALIEKAANAAGEPVSAWARQLLLHAAEKQASKKKK